MATKISDFFSEYNVKDNATRVIKKVTTEDKKLSKALKNQNKAFDKNQKEVKESSKTLKKYSQDTQKATREAGKFSRALKKIGRGGARAGKIGGGIAKGGGGGNVLGAAGAAIPVLGALVIAAVASIEKAAAAISTAAQVRGERAQFGRATVADPGLAKQAKQLGRAGFAADDVQKALARLSETGITKISQAQLKVIQTEAKRVGSVTQAIENILSGKGFRSLGQAGKNIESIAENLQFTSQSAVNDFNVITQNIGAVQKSQAKLINKQIKETDSFRKTQRKQLALQRSDANNAIKLQGRVGLRQIQIARKAQAEVTATIAKGASSSIKKGARIIEDPERFAKTLIPKILGGSGESSSAFFKGKSKPKRASGGPVQAGKSFIVGEKRAEVFTPDQSGRIAPNTNGARGGGGVTMGNINITINTAATNVEGIGAILEQKLPGILNSFANKTLARQLGLSGGLA